MSDIYKTFEDGALTALTSYMKETRTKAVSNEAAITGLGEDLATAVETINTDLENNYIKKADAGTVTDEEIIALLDSDEDIPDAEDTGF